MIHRDATRCGGLRDLVHRARSDSRTSGKDHSAKSRTFSVREGERERIEREREGRERENRREGGNRKEGEGEYPASAPADPMKSSLRCFFFTTFESTAGAGAGAGEGLTGLKTDTDRLAKLNLHFLSLSLTLSRSLILSFTHSLSSFVSSVSHTPAR